nr:immunoglobulin heavy chain junction region [Macaca mulatta]MOW93333.1 immunoglobulin heavy chain junction region [Macaca mulatta]MOW93982.1 immunoglobulin heavy chain junction region [Macaca mulatta]MOW94232.1 immunoglobulin heavy chain junction region [Macaca mulatta]MOW94464.1 immunoglobulin heavy chain junction region [Macaca mulatta]
CARQDTNYDSW